MKLTDEQIVKLIADAFRVGRAEGMEIGQKDGYASGLEDGRSDGYEEGWEEGWDKGYDAGEKDAEFQPFEEEEEEAGFAPEEYECQCPQCTNSPDYAMGWHDGYTESGVDLDMAENEAYMDGYLQGRDDRATKVEEA